ncbi:natural cytotoxicity triggering receptor 3 ligand 1 [Alligator mississippiensis]|uniref:natural cytotoxicity triggering receptor 3 ligand 1 n=1 Tax=Alligator mississippiensis TaxID=8496 RepID=UPI0028773A9E|nr:natural cytotoxicity triggering receptor 3 ligand 1 [Alligator mississippiensis]
MATVAGKMDAWALHLRGLLLPLLFLGITGSQLQVTTAPSSTAHVGSGALLQCRFDVGGPVALDSLRVTWYFWDKQLACYEQGRSQAHPKASLPSEKELENGNASLSLTAVTVPDEGIYRCVVWYGTQQHQGKTTLHMLAAPMISIPRQTAVADAETSLLCHVGRFYPVDVDVAWLRDGQVLKGSTCSRPQRNPDGTFNLTLTYTFTPTLSDAGSVFSCHVYHAALEQLQQEDIPLDILEADKTGTMVGAILGILIGAGAAAATAIYFWRKRKRDWAVSYNVSEVQVPERCMLGQEVTLHCSMEGTFPKDVAVTWERIHSEDRMVPDSGKDQESPEHQPLFPALPPGWRVTEERAGTRLTSSLIFTPTLQDDGAWVQCFFLHEYKLIREHRVSPVIQVWARPQVSEIQVLPEWDPRDKVPFAVQLHNFYPREVPPIQWGWDGAGSWREDPAQIDKNADGTFTATSIWRVPSRSLTWPELRVRVCVQHGPGEPPSERELSLRAAGVWGLCGV